jgi:hypothetical protein
MRISIGAHVRAALVRDGYSQTLSARQHMCRLVFCAAGRRRHQQVLLYLNYLLVDDQQVVEMQVTTESDMYV